MVALRSCQEALANARKHAGSSVAVSLALAYADDQLTVSVRDDGCGFDPGAVSGGYGLAGLRTRAAEVGGTAVVRSAAGEGTTVTVRLPISPAAPVAPVAPVSSVPPASPASPVSPSRSPR